MKFSIKDLVTRISSFATIGLLACSGGDDARENPEGRLLAAEEQPYDGTAEEQRLREMQYLKVVTENYPEDGRTELWDIATSSAGSPDTVGGLLVAGVLGHSEICSFGVNTCEYLSCQANLAVEFGDLLMEIAQGVTPVTVLPIWHATGMSSLPVGSTPISTSHTAENLPIVILPQSTATRQLFARKAAAYYRDAVDRSRSAFTAWDNSSCTAEYNELERIEMSRAAALALQAATLGLEAAMGLNAELTVAVADQQLGSSTQAAIATARGMAGSELSRAAAAHDLVGGNDGIFGNTARALCVDGELTPQAWKAIEVIRDLAPSPARIVAIADSLTISSSNDALDAFLNENETGGSLKQRLEEFYGVEISGSLESYFDLSLTDFGRATRYLADEIRTFSRSYYQQLPSQDPMATFPKYAGVASQPSDLPDAYWVALARTDAILRQDADWQSIPAAGWGLDVPGGADTHPGDLATGLALATFVMSDAFGVESIPEASVVFERLEAAIAGSEALGMFQHEVSPNSDNDNFTINLFRDPGTNAPGAEPASGDYYIALGDDAMKCAVLGHVDGARNCHPATAAAHLPGSPTTLSRMSALSATRGFSASYRTTVRAGSRRVYLLRVRDDWVPEVTNPYPSAGDFLAITGIASERNIDYGAPSSTYQSRVFGVVPSVESRAAQLMKVAQDECSRPLVRCGAYFFDERIPLDNSLSDDTDGVENSWRYYLSQAAEAAAESDRLVQEYISAELTGATRAESLEDKKRAQVEKATQELDNLQNICGTSVDVTSLLSYMGWNDQTGEVEELAPPSPPATCTAGNPVPGFNCYVGSGHFDETCGGPDDVADDHVCINGRQVRVWNKAVNASTDPEMAKLHACIGSFATTRPFTHISTSKVAFCPEGGPAVPAGFAGDLPCQSTKLERGAEDSFQFLEVPAPPDVDLTSTCAEVRKVRKWVQGSGVMPYSSIEEPLERFRKSGIFSNAQLQNLRSQLVVEAKYGGYVDVSLAGRHWFSTGDAAGGGATGWPCEADEGGAPTLPEDCVSGVHEGQDSIGCSYYQCGHLEHSHETARLNDRILDAFIALQLMSQPYESPNSAEEQHIEFWFPALVATNLVPKGYGQSRPFDVLQPGPTMVSIDERTNDRWRMYAPNAYPTGYNVAFRRRGVDYPIDGVKVFSNPREGAFAELAYNVQFGRRTSGVLENQETIGGFFGSIGGGVGNVNNYVPQGCSGQDYFERVMSLSSGTGGANLAVAHQAALGVTAGCLEWNPEDSERTSVFPRVNLSDYARAFMGCENSVGSNIYTFLDVPAEERGLTADEVEYNAAYNRDPYAICAEYAIDPLGDSLNLYQNPIAAWDALELACEAAERLGGRRTCTPPDRVESTGDLNQAAFYMDCLAEQIKSQVAGTVFRGVPDVVFQLGKGASGPVAIPGELGSAVSEVLEAISALSDTGEELSRIYKGFAVEMRQIGHRIEIENLEDELSDLGYQSQQWNNITSCATATLEAANWSDTIFKNGVKIASAGVTCGNAIHQTNLANQMREVEQEINEHQRAIIFGDGETEALRLERALADEEDRIREEVARAQRGLATIESLSQSARRSLDKALWHLRYQNEKAAAITETMSAQGITAQERYTRAHENAVKWAFLARRAIEQRLGLSLSSLTEDLPLVESPFLWADSACATSPVDYENVASGGGSFADAFIGEYVRKLENVVESYRLQFGFADGSDTAVVSLRDDLLNVRTNCEVPSKNLLYHASGLADARRTEEPVREGWSILGCPVNDAEGSDELCLSVEPDGSPFNAPGALESASGVRLTFDDGGTQACEGQLGDAEFTCAWHEDVRIAQEVVLPPGTYRFSWYSYPVAAGEDADALKTAGRVWDSNGAELSSNPAYSRIAAVTSQAGAVLTWDRYYTDFSISSTTAVSVGFELDVQAQADSNSPWHDLWELQVGAPMLEALNFTLSPNEPPSRFSNTGATLTEIQQVCEDTTGETFRGRWSDRLCAQVCPEGIGVQCSASAIEQCYREISFFIDQRSIEQGDSLIYSGFARGNFNYRIQSVGLNFVGSGVRDCAASSLPSTCHSGGFVPYSLYHKGPYMVRNHYSENYRALLFEGVIEHARGLGAERYFSNPISSTDRELLADFTRTEYQGRPLDGQFTIRVWEEPGVEFNAIEDVQVILDYQYWSR